jgi:hypothetical protein
VACVIYFLPRHQLKEVASMQSAHLSALVAKHAVLDRQIEAESQRPRPDSIIIAGLKKQKLRVKEEMSLA